MTESTDLPPQRILIANENQRHLDEISALVRAAGHEVIARLVRPEQVDAELQEQHPDLAIVAVGAADEHALNLIDELASSSDAPIVIYLDAPDPAFVERAIKLGAFACITQADPAEVETQVMLALHRHHEMAALQANCRRRVVIERAKGMLMERHGIGERLAFEHLRDDAHSRRAPVLSIALEMTNGSG